MQQINQCHIFCKVIDNFGDIGVCLRLARQLVCERSWQVSIWIDDAISLAMMYKTLDVNDIHDAALQIEGINIYHWGPLTHIGYKPEQVPDVVIEAFACMLPQDYMSAMARKKTKPVWLNLEYLSAEPWVISCHTLASPHPTLALTKFFFFPGFVEHTGGLLRERDLFSQHDIFSHSTVMQQDFFSPWGIGLTSYELRISLFCYNSAPVTTLLNYLQQLNKPTICFVPEGVASDQLRAFFDTPIAANTCLVRNNLTVCVLPFLTQADYDKLLWSCDLNFVRGEDSFVRAGWAAHTFVWHIYPQDDDAHWVKLNAFLTIFLENAPAHLAQVVRDFWHYWNAVDTNIDNKAVWDDFYQALPALSRYSKTWADQLAKQRDLVGNLCEFIQKIS